MKRLLCAVVLISICVALANAQTWTLEGPASRQSHTAVYDPVSAQMIIFGGQATATGQGLNDVWLGSAATTQAVSFTQLITNGTAPQGRYGHVAAYDSVNNRMMLFGGALGMPSPCTNDAWILDAANGKNGTPTWIAQSPSGTAPAARVYSAGAYDSTTNSLIIFGGDNCTNGYLNDVWILTGANGLQGTPAWRKLATSGVAPSKRESAAAIYDSVNNILTLHGGDAGAGPFGDVWTLSHANGTGGTAVWTKLTPVGTAPRARTGHSATYDTANNRMTIFGGANKTTTMTDSWVLANPNGIGTPMWIQIATTGTAPSLAYHSAVYSQSQGYLFVFAGASSANKLSSNSHAFTLTGANGLAQTASKWILGGPPVRYGQSAFYDSATNSIFVFGGQHSRSNLNYGDYWQASRVIGSSNLKWGLVPSKGGAPSARFGHTGVYDPLTDRLMIFGGSKGTCLNDYRVLQHPNLQGGSPTWTGVTPAGTAPLPRMMQASAYDPASNTLMIFGGYDCASTYFNDVWVMSNANNASGQPTWNQLAPDGEPPSVRESSTAIYDPTTNSLIVYGGDEGGTPFGDLWILSNANGSGGTPVWTQIFAVGDGPPARSGHTATYDVVNNVMTVYGGFDGTNVVGDVWMLAGANAQTGTLAWTQGLTGQSRRFASSMYDPVSNEMITFGGASNSTPLTPEADVYTLTNANGLPPRK